MGSPIDAQAGQCVAMSNLTIWRPSSKFEDSQTNIFSGQDWWAGEWAGVLCVSSEDWKEHYDEPSVFCKLILYC